MADDLGFQPIESEAAPAALIPTEDDAKAARMKKRRKWLLGGVGGVLVKVAIVGGAHWWLVDQHFVKTDNAYVGASTAQVNAQTAGQIQEVRADDTQPVKAGQILAIIDPADARLAVARAEADYRRAEQRVRQYYAQESGAEATLQARQADLTRTQADYQRRRALAQTGAISGEELTATQGAYDAARANLAAAQQSLEAQRALTRDWTVENHPETAAARAQLETARLSLARTTVRAPVDGIVVQRRIQVGQRIDIGQSMMSVSPLQAVYVDANFKEGQLGKVRIGQKVELTSDLYGEKIRYHGRVTGLGGGTGSAFAVIPAQNATGNWIKVVQRVPVRIAIDPAQLAKHPLRVGLSMEARIDTRERT
jgi:membrane fusion protein (multidrug efflux system)